MHNLITRHKIVRIHIFSYNNLFALNFIDLSCNIYGKVTDK